MKKTEHSPEAWKVICGILIAIIVFLLYMWNQSENNRLKLLDELNELKDRQEYRIGG